MCAGGGRWNGSWICRVEGSRQDWSDPGYRHLAGSCAHNNETSDLITFRTWVTTVSLSGRTLFHGVSHHRNVPVNVRAGCVISDFRRQVDANCALLGFYAASSGNSLPTFRDNLSVPSSKVKESLGWDGYLEERNSWRMQFHSVVRTLNVVETNGHDTTRHASCSAWSPVSPSV